MSDVPTTSDIVSGVCAPEEMSLQRREIERDKRRRKKKRRLVDTGHDACMA